MKKKAMALFTAVVIAAGQFLPAAAAQTADNAPAYRMEALDRGLAVVNSGGNMYLSWRLLGTESYNTSFIVYRDGVALAEVSDSTNYVDKGGTMTSVYTVAPKYDLSAISQEVSAWESGENYIDIKFDPPAGGSMMQNEISNKNDTGNDYSQEYTYTPNDVSTGDLDGDGQYELVVKFMPSNAGESLPPTYTANVILGAYELDGTPVWGTEENPLYINLGVNVRANPHGTQFLVYDFDGDGRAEISTKTAQGTFDTAGDMLLESETAPDYYKTVSSSNYTEEQLTNSYSSTLSHAATNGQVLCGREYYSVFDGETGKFIDTTAYHATRTYNYYDEYNDNCKKELAYLWGDNFGNRSERYTATVSYLDGTGEPYMVEWRGYYHGRDTGLGRTAVGAYKLEKDELSLVYSFDTAGSVLDKLDNNTLNWNNVFGSDNAAIKALRTDNPDYKYCGNGNHNITNADVDDDGMDEIISGSLCLQVKDGQLTPKWNYGKGHGDALHIGRYIKGENMQYFTVHEDSPYGMTLIDPYYDGDEDGKPEVIFHEDGGGDTGRGLMLKGDADGFIIDSVSNDARKVTFENGSYVTSEPIGYTSDKPDESDDDTMDPDATASPEPTSSPTTNAFNQRTGTGGRYSLNFRIFWDGDLYEELFDSDNSARAPHIGKYDPELEYAPWIFTFADTLTNNSSKCNPALTADIIGDWREEVICRLADNSGLRLFMSDIYTGNKLYTLMHDPTYRCGVAAEQSAYNQPPHVGYYVGEDMTDYQWQEITTVAANNQDAHRYNWKNTDAPQEIAAGSVVLADKLAQSATTYNVSSENGTITFNNNGSSYAGYNLYEAVTENSTVSFDITPGENLDASLQLRDSRYSNLESAVNTGRYANMVANLFFKDGTLNCSHSSGDNSSTKICDIDANVKYNIKIYCDFGTERTFYVEVRKSDTNELVAEYSNFIRQTDAKNLKRITFFTDEDYAATEGNSFTLDNLFVWTGELPHTAVLTPGTGATTDTGSSTVTSATAQAGTSVTYTPEFYGSSGARMTGYDGTLSYKVLKGDTLAAATEVTDGTLTFEGGTLAIAQNAVPGSYYITAADDFTTGLSLLEVTSPRELTTADMAIEAKYAPASISGDTMIYESVSDMEKEEGGQTAESLGITADTQIITVTAGLCRGIDESVYKIDNVELSIISDTVNETVSPHIFDSSLMMAQFFGEGFGAGTYSVTAKVSYSINGTAATNTVELSDSLTVEEPSGEKQFKEYYYQSNGVNVSLMVFE